MKAMLQTGDLFLTGRGHRGRVAEWLGEGAQGAVFAAELDGARLALKWYHPASATAEQRLLLDQIIQAGPPHAAFLWPLDRVSSPERAGFGYLMPLRPPGFWPLAQIMTRTVEAGFSAVAEAGFQLAHAFLHLHARGFCYRDISFGNLFLHPETGDICIADNDNIQPDGGARAGVVGTPRFMAPELVRGEASPGIQTDLFSLAVVLFYLLLLHHPLEGRREAEIHSLDLPAMARLYGRHPVFIFDPLDSSNRPVPELHANALTFWPMYPPFVRTLFLRAFGEGLLDPWRRVRETEWRQAMAALWDLTFPCDACGAENPHPEPYGPAAPICWGCQRPLPRPLGLRFRDRTVLLPVDRRLSARSIEGAAAFDPRRPFAVVEPHPAHPGRLGLKNLTAAPWRCSLPGRSPELLVPAGRSVALLPGLVFHWTDEAEVGIV